MIHSWMMITKSYKLFDDKEDIDDNADKEEQKDSNDDDNDDTVIESL